MVEARQLGRVASVFSVGNGLVQLTAAIGAGLLAEQVGLRTVSFVAPIGALVGALILWASPVRSLRTLPGGRRIEVADPAAVVVAVERDQPIGG
jgi:predicted NAD/FAD-binding protein